MKWSTPFFSILLAAAGLSTVLATTATADNQYLLEAIRSGSNNNAAAAIDFGGALNGPNDWVMQTDMTLLENTGSGSNSIGFAGFSILPDLDVDRYLADIRVSDGRIRINGFTGDTNADGGPVNVGDELRLTWATDFDAPNPGEVTMTLTYDNLTTGLTGVVSGAGLIADLKPGTWFGYRNRALNVDGTLQVLFDDFSVTGAVDLFEDFEDEMLGEMNPGMFLSQPASGTGGISNYAVVPEPASALILLPVLGLLARRVK